MSFVVIEKNQASVPSDQDISTALVQSGGAAISIQGTNASKRVDFSGVVNHTVFENNLIAVAKGKRTSWNFTWADGTETETGLEGAELDDTFASITAQVTVGATPYEIDITMAPATVTALLNGNYNLYGFKAVQAAQGGGAPLVWFQLTSTEYSALTQLQWSVQYQAYTSTSTIVPNGKVTASYATNVELGQQLNVEPGGIGNVTTAGPATAISVYNTTSTQFTAGISQQAADGSNNPMCAFPLYGQQLDVIAPIEKVLLMFSTQPVNTGTVIEQAYSPGVLIDLTSSNQRAVAYDINAGWSWGGYSWAQTVAANENLVPLLIETSSASANAAIEPRSLVIG
jgi:hypothetical protein